MGLDKEASPKAFLYT